MLFTRLHALTLCLFCLVAVGMVRSQNTSAPVRDTEKRIHPKILTGKEAPAGRFPYMCSLRLRGSREHRCGGIVIHPQWVLTAAHCVDPDYYGSVGLQPVIYCGIHGIDDYIPELTFTAVIGILHPRWNGEVEKGFDIAMLKLNRTAGSHVPEMLAKNNDLMIGSHLTALGWGKTEISYYSKRLHMTELSFAPRQICRNDGYFVDDDIMICAGLSHANTCEGDSGGPLLLPDAPEGELKAGLPELDLVVGITSYGRGLCTDKDSTLGIYTRVGHYSDWIQSVIDSAAVNQESKTETERSGDDDEMTSAIAPENQDSAPPSASELDLDEHYMDGMFELFSESEQEDLEPTEGQTASPSESAQPAQSDSCATSPRLANVVAATRDDAVDIVRAALECGLNPDSRYNTTFQRYDRTLLHWAASYDSSDSAEALGDSGANVEAKDSFGDTPLHNCGLFGSASVAKVLISSGANLNAKGRYRFGPLHYAASDGHVKVAKLLIGGGADVDARDDAGQTPLHAAAIEDRSDIVKILVDAGADIDAMDDVGETPLHKAAAYGSLNVAEVLVEAGASKKIRDENGRRPEDIVCEESFLACNILSRSRIEDLVAP